jgi:eukaryotic-like serine/threonine-protein kinase
MGSVVVVSAITSAVVTGAVLLATHIGGTLFDTDPRAVPDLSGTTVDSAGTLLTAQRLTLVVAGEEHNAQIAAGRICRQVPQSGSQVPPSTPIQVWSSLGPEPARVPEVAGMTLDAAIAALSHAGLRRGTLSEESGPGAPGSIVRSSPAAGTDLERGAAVDLVARPSTVFVEVPNLVGQSRRTAREMITQAGLTVGEERMRFDDLRAPYAVLSQDPAAGAQVPQGSPINLVENEGD